jgi:CheY-like chemotaxis protein
VAGENILVVEDTDLFRHIYEDKLTQDGYVVRSASDGIEALNILRNEQVDLVVLDLIMPRMSGLEALDAMKADPRTREIPVIVLSNLGQETDIQRGLDMGAADYLIKSAAKPADVSAKIRDTLIAAAGSHVEPASYRLHMRDHEGDADRLVSDAELQRRLWCPSCEEELAVELIQDLEHPGWYQAHLVCESCGRTIGH